MLNASEGSNNSNSWHSVDDVLHSFNSISKISKYKSHYSNDTERFSKKSKFEGGSSFCQDNTVSIPNEKYLPSVMGRGRMIRSLEEKFDAASLDNQIHSELRQLNPCGFSNDAIEEQFGSVSKNISCFSEEINSSSSPIKETNNFDYENNIYEPAVYEDLNDIEKSDDLFDGGSTSKKSIITKGKKRRCRNFLVLQLSSRENQDNTSNPVLKGPNEFLKQSEMPTTAAKLFSSQTNEFTFLSSDFPPI